jgi:hypothetical protein
MQNVLAKKPSRSPEEEEFIANMQSTWEKARKIGHDEGKAAGKADAVLGVLLARGISVTDSERSRIVTERDPNRLAAWLKKAIVATSAAEVIAERNRANKPLVPTAPTAPEELPPTFALRRHIGHPLDTAGDGQRRGLIGYSIDSL